MTRRIRPGLTSLRERLRALIWIAWLRSVRRGDRSGAWKYVLGLVASSAAGAIGAVWFLPSRDAPAYGARLQTRTAGALVAVVTLAAVDGYRVGARFRTAPDGRMADLFPAQERLLVSAVLVSDLFGPGSAALLAAGAAALYRGSGVASWMLAGGVVLSLTVRFAAAVAALSICRRVTWSAGRCPAGLALAGFTGSVSPRLAALVTFDLVFWLRNPGVLSVLPVLLGSEAFLLWLLKPAFTTAGAVPGGLEPVLNALVLAAVAYEFLEFALPAWEAPQRVWLIRQLPVPNHLQPAMRAALKLAICVPAAVTLFLLHGGPGPLSRAVLPAVLLLPLVISSVAVADLIGNTWLRNRSLSGPLRVLAVVGGLMAFYWLSLMKTPEGQWLVLFLFGLITFIAIRAVLVEPTPYLEEAPARGEAVPRDR